MEREEYSQTTVHHLQRSLFDDEMIKGETITLKYKNGEVFYGRKKVNTVKNGIYANDSYLYECVLCHKIVGKKHNLRIHCRKHSQHLVEYRVDFTCMKKNTLYMYR